MYVNDPPLEQLNTFLYMLTKTIFLRVNTASLAPVNQLVSFTRTIYFSHRRCLTADLPQALGKQL